jgi:hypothetical protein
LVVARLPERSVDQINVFGASGNEYFCVGLAGRQFCLIRFFVYAPLLRELRLQKSSYSLSGRDVLSSNNSPSSLIRPFMVCY